MLYAELRSLQVPVNLGVVDHLNVLPFVTTSLIFKYSGRYSWWNSAFVKCSPAKVLISCNMWRYRPHTVFKEQARHRDSNERQSGNSDQTILSKVVRCVSVLPNTKSCFSVITSSAVFIYVELNTRLMCNRMVLSISGTISAFPCMPLQQGLRNF